MEVSALTHPSTMPGLRGPSALLRLQSDERLIALTRRGQPAAFETLCARYQSRLLAFCRHMLSSREDAEDVLQEVFAAAFNAVLADERAINVRPWLYRIARNRSLNHLRRASAIGVDTMDVHYAENGLSTSDKVLRRESFRELIADVHELPETQRTALLLREIDALSYEQIAQAMETTVPSVKSLLVRARISLAEAAEARKLSCEEVRLELGEAAEGLAKLSTPARRHVRGCERCLFFKKQLKENNRVLAAIMPVGPLLLLKKALIAKLGSASAGGAHVAGSAGVSAGATIGAGAAAGGGSFAGGLMTAGAGALATKAVAGLAAAAIVTAGAVAADHAVVVHHHRAAHPSRAYASLPAEHPTSQPVVVHERAQPVSSSSTVVHRVDALASRRAHRLAAKLKAKTTPPAPSAAPATPTPPTASAPALTTTQPVASPVPVQVTEVTTETTQLPSTATSEAPPSPPPSTTTTSTTPTDPTTSTTPTVTPVPVPLPTAEPVPVPEPAPTPVEVAPEPKRAPRHHAGGGTEAPAPRLSESGWGGRRSIRR